MEHVQIPTLKCKLTAFLIHLDYTAAYFKKGKDTNARITSSICALAASALNANSYFTQRWAWASQMAVITTLAAKNFLKETEEKKYIFTIV